MGDLTIYGVFWFLSWLYIHDCLASEVQLSANPATITKGLTESLKLRCALQDTQSGVVVGRQISSTNYNIEHVNSIIISRVNSDETVTALAQILTSESPEVFDGSQTLSIDGTLTPNDAADPEYLELTWTSPGDDQSGSYVCEVNGLDLQGHGVMLQSSVAIDIADPDVEDLVKNFNDLKATVNVLTSQIQDLIKENNDLKAIVATHQAPHSEEGIVYCGNSNTWTALPDGQKELVKAITFKQPYTNRPVISIASVGGDIDSSTQERYHWRLSDVTTTGFNIVCSTWGDSLYYGLDLRWTSFVA